VCSVSLSEPRGAVGALPREHTRQAVDVDTKDIAKGLKIAYR
jgi:hypothetical protein